MRKVRRKAGRVAGEPRAWLVSERLPARWWSKLHCPRCQTLATVERCCFGQYRVFCEKSGCGFVTCSEDPSGLNGRGGSLGRGSGKEAA